jgi:hypothetical protein
MRKMTNSKKIRIVALVALGIVLAVSAPSQAAGEGGHGGGGMGGHGGGGMGGHGGGGMGGHGGDMEHHGFAGHDFGGHEGHDFGGHEGHDFDRHEGHDFDRHDFDGRFGFGFGPFFPYYPPYEAVPGYRYYCPSDGAYYPSVTSCAEPWVTVPAD